MVHLGLISYGLYVWQQSLLNDSNTSWTGHFPQNILLALAAGEISYRYIEAPFRKKRRETPAGAEGGRFP